MSEGKLEKNPGTAEAGPDLEIVVTEGDNKGISAQLGVDLLIGTRDGCGLHLSDINASPYHAIVRRHQDGFFLIDLMGEGGTYLNGEPVRLPARTFIGDEVRIGRTTLLIRPSRQMPAGGNGVPVRQNEVQPAAADSRVPEPSHLPVTTVPEINKDTLNPPPSPVAPEAETTIKTLYPPEPKIDHDGRYQSMTCPSCGSPLTPGKRFCGGCGAPGSSQVKKEMSSQGTPSCPKCGNPVTPSKKFCGNCGEKLEG